jgi:hypothetical protein
MSGWQAIPGWYDFGDVYTAAVADAPADRPTVMVEIGVAFGRSLAHLARLVIDSKKPITVVGIDPWVDDWNPDWSKDEATRPAWGAEHAEWARAQGGPFSAFLKMMQQHAPEELEFVKVMRGRGVECMRALPPSGTVHMVWIDGDHRYEGVAGDIAGALALSPAWLGGHDFTPDFPGVERAVYDTFPGCKRVGNSWLARGVMP